MRLFANRRNATYFWSAGISALMISALAISASSAAPNRVKDAHEAIEQDAATVAPPTAAQLFDDAPYGVDPMVTGPVSTAFKQQQEAAGCESAAWPNVPAVCYPD